MEYLPFTIQKFVFKQTDQLEQTDLVAIDADQGVDGRIPGYFVMSSAPPNIEEASKADQALQRQAFLGLEEIVERLHHMAMQSQDGTAELVIVIHGYNTTLAGFIEWCSGIFKFINRPQSPMGSQANQVFIGYRWPSENVEFSLKKIWEALAALPRLPRDFLVGGMLGALLLLVIRIMTLGASRSNWPHSWFLLLISAVLVLLLVLGILMAALVLLRLIVYFRDAYRADNFGVLDLVELLRRVDQALVIRTAQALASLPKDGQDHDQTVVMAQKQWREQGQNKIKLSFIGHSMGGFVVTNVIRILSDVFDSRSIDQKPSPDVGDVFRLQRLILASPDIPVLTIISNRANFLATSLRRFPESYLFCNEGDVALRLASTAANYIAFPSRTQARGYRLGNVALQNTQGNSDDYGLINLSSLDQELLPRLPMGEALAGRSSNAMESLFITYHRLRGSRVVTLADLFKVQSDGDSSRPNLADLFTYFDCTDYWDFKYDPQRGTRSLTPMGLLSRAKRKPVLKAWDYFFLTLDYARGKRDVHGGYFQGQFTQELLYGLAFLGFGRYLDSLDSDRQIALTQFHLTCKTKQIQGFLSPFRYRVDIQGAGLEETRGAMLEAIKANTKLSRGS
ncbi:MAG: alpha/beta hydrolase [Cyanobacteria bacterium REEB459]|nr:alpha/beta hydrolase [Cyanobacteria bacterium REEB459]